MNSLVHEEGFDGFGIARPRLNPEIKKRFDEFLRHKRHGSMVWLEAERDRRSDPKAIWKDAQSVIMLGKNYGPQHNPLNDLEKTDCGTISVYARNRDYHDLIKGSLKRIATNLGARARQLGLSPDFKVFVDTAPVMEKPLAEAAGVGWQGKHTNLVSRDFGSWLFLGAIFTDLDLPVSKPETDHCGQCRACLDICPTAAFPAPYQLDARRCISYLTIEHKGPIDRDLRPLIGNRIFGCDDCLAICPWNKFASEAGDIRLKERADLSNPLLAKLVTLSDSGFRSLFSGSPVKRIGRDRFVRNVLIAIGNSALEDFIPAVHERLEDESELVRGAAVWALMKLTGASTFRTLAEKRMGTETSEEVLSEWQSALKGSE